MTSKPWTAIALLTLTNSVLSLVLVLQMRAEPELISIHPLHPPMTRAHETVAVVVKPSAEPYLLDAELGAALHRAFITCQADHRKLAISSLQSKIMALETDLTNLAAKGQSLRLALDRYAFLISRVLGPAKMRTIIERKTDLTREYDAPGLRATQNTPIPPESTGSDGKSSL